ncbi:MAG: HD domain-containing protein [Magnetococcales bacterium]|nr:HD domain-containing protein [Magnetococcales bacterium]
MGSNPPTRTQAEIEADLEAQMAALDDWDDEEAGPAEEPPPPPVTTKPPAVAPPLIAKAPFREELPQASNIKRQARKLVGTVLEDARMGRQVEVQQVKDVVAEMTESMLRNPDALLSLSLIKQNDEYTFMHSVNVGVFLMFFARALGHDEAVVTQVGIGGMLHDIGKMRVPPEILHKPGKLTDEEFQEMRKHALHSSHILQESPGISEISITVAGQHHEKYNGRGYPMSLKGDQINHFGQMAAIVDVYDAITSDRCYHKGNTPALALKRMYEWSSNDFDPGLFQKFVQCVGIYPLGSLVRLENQLLGVVVETNRGNLLHPIVRIIIDAKQKKRVEPREVDLLAWRGKEGGYRIIGHEPAEKWGVDPKQHLTDPQLFQ